jgi:hypothetical protein
MHKYNYKQLPKLINLTIKLCNTTHYLHFTDNTHAAKNAAQMNPRTEGLKQYRLGNGQ